MTNTLLFRLLIATVIGGLSDAHVILVNDTGLPIARMEIDGKAYESWGEGGANGKILMSVTPKKHHLKLVFRGGANVNWPHFDFAGVHEIIFERKANKIEAHIE